MAARSKAWVCGLSLFRSMGSKPAGVMDVLSLISVVCCQRSLLQGRSLVRSSSTECGVSECDRGTSKREGLGPLRLLEP